jgi:hypothetical protein
MKFEIKNRWTGAVQYTCELAAEVAGKSYGLQLGFAIKAAHGDGAVLRDADLRDADLRDADLRGADLRDANLIGANLSGANLRDADLRGADLIGADLSGANLSGANLIGANLIGADLSGANLSGANLIGANLIGANLSDANLIGANLSGADLIGANLRSFKADMWMTLTENPGEVPALIQSLRAGKVNGSVYEGDCACLVGTIAKAKGVDYHKLTHNSSNPAEQWFLMIKQGDKPGDDTGGGFAAKIALEWAEEFCRLRGIVIPVATS